MIAPYWRFGFSPPNYFPDGSKGLVSSSYHDCGGLLFFARRSNRALLIGRNFRLAFRTFDFEAVVAMIAIPASLSTSESTWSTSIE
jgi:hypothetical protein